jgi:hypothetical protein
MPGRDKQPGDEELEITAQPKSLGEELAVQIGHEQGLSVDPEDLGRTWLSDATEQGNFESARGGENDDLWASSAASSDEALPGPNFEVDKDVWENTVSLVLQNGAGAVSNPLVEDEDSVSDDGLHAIADRESGDIDLTQSSVQEASLFDHEVDEPGETEGPHTVITEDSHTHARHPGVQPAPAWGQGAVAAAKALVSTESPAKSSGPKSSAPKASSSRATALKDAPSKGSKTIKPPAKKPPPAKASKPKAARSNAPRAR